jgi:predicted RNA binding protein YcfA (HicA-like mRNA interferase family)
MGRLAGFRYREVAQRLRAFGFRFDRPGAGSHEVWRHSVTGRKVPSRIIPETWLKER